MKRIKTAPRMIFAAWLAAMLCGRAISAYGAGLPDLSRTGSISLYFYSEEAGAAVTEGALTLYEAAELAIDNGEPVYLKTEGFSGYEGSLDVEDAGMAAALAEYAAGSGAAGTVREIGPDGRVEFTGLTPGLYLIVQTTGSAGYYPIEPFLVNVPFAQGGTWVYSVEAGPKVELCPETLPETPGGDVPDSTAPVPSSAPEASFGARLPQTGQRVWTAALLGTGGLFFAVLGAVRRKNSRA